jgi:hypothetical protein
MENDLDSKEELSVYSSAKELSKKILLDGISRQVSDPGFDIVNFARLLEQDDGGENGLNPLHSVFTPHTVQHAKKFLRAVELLDEYFASLPEADELLAVSVEEEDNSND